MRLFAWILAAGLALGAEEPVRPVPKESDKPLKPSPALKPVTMRDAKVKRNKYRAPKPHTAKRAKDAAKRVGGKKQAHPKWGKVTSTHKH